MARNEDGVQPKGSSDCGASWRNNEIKATLLAGDNALVGNLTRDGDQKCVEGIRAWNKPAETKHTVSRWRRYDGDWAGSGAMGIG
jgi:hypothetical protein